MSDDNMIQPQNAVVIPVNVARFPTATPVAIQVGVIAFTEDGPSRSIEFFLQAGHTPADFLARIHWFDARHEAQANVQWPGIDLSQFDLSGCVLQGANLVGVTFGRVAGADLTRAKLDRARIGEAPGSNFDLAELFEATLQCASLEAASFCGAALGGADLGEAGLRRADFRDADISGADFSGTELHDSTVHLARRAAGADFTEASGLTWSQRETLRDLGAVGLEEIQLFHLGATRPEMA
jgi:uncharacterized protein YjbI with pentapeptide repeats